MRNMLTRPTTSATSPRALPVARALLLAMISLACAATTAQAFNGPFGTLVTVEPGVELDVDVRWPNTGSPPAAGWPVIFFAHGGGGDKTTWGPLAGNFADLGYVTLTYTNRPKEDRSYGVLASDIVVLKTWLLNDFETEAGVSAPTDTNAYGMTGNSLGGITTLSGLLLTNALATAVPFNWGFHFFVDGVESNGSLERVTGADPAITLSGEYPAVAVDAGFEAVAGPVVANLSSVTIPVQNHIAMLDGRGVGSHALSDHLAMTSSSQRMIYLGTGGHNTANSDVPFREDLRLRWFDHHLKGVANGIGSEDPIRMALLRTNEHVSYPSWPPPGQTSDTLYLGTSGRLSLNAPTSSVASDTFENDPGSFTWSTLPNFEDVTLRAAVARDVLRYDSDPLDAEALVVGEPSVTLHVAGTGSRYQVNAHLFDVSPTNEPTLLAVGTATTDLSPTTLTIPLSVTGRRIPAGHRLRLEITNRDDQDIDPTDGHTPESGALRYIPFLEFSSNTVFFDVARPSSVEIPLVGSAVLPIAPPVPSFSMWGMVFLGLGITGVAVRHAR